MKMKQVMSHNINNGLLNIIRRTDPMIRHTHIRQKRGTAVFFISELRSWENPVRKIQIQKDTDTSIHATVNHSSPSCLDLKFLRFQNTRSKHNASFFQYVCRTVLPYGEAKIQCFCESAKKKPKKFQDKIFRLMFWKGVSLTTESWTAVFYILLWGPKNTRI